jgi:hypothetical protein
MSGACDGRPGERSHHECGRFHRGDRRFKGRHRCVALVEIGSRQTGRANAGDADLRRRRGEVAVTVWRPGESAEDIACGRHHGSCQHLPSQVDPHALVIRSGPNGRLVRYAPKGAVRPSPTSASRAAVAGQVGPKLLPEHELTVWSTWAARQRRVRGSGWWRRREQDLHCR